MVGLRRALARAHSSRRVRSVLLVYLVVTIAMGWRLVDVQVINADDYRALADRQSQLDLELPAQRGKLYDRGGEPLAMSLDAATIYADPQLVRDSGWTTAQVAAALAPVVNRPRRQLHRDLVAGDRFVYLARQRSRAVGEKVLRMEVPGVNVLSEPRRTYPAGSLAAQVVGFAGVDHEGLSGLELQYNEALKGESGRLRQERAPGGLTISNAPREIVPAHPGTDLVLTLDRQIQYTAERVLDEAVERYNAIGGSALVLDVDSGELLAIASVPNFDPAKISAASGYARRNRALTDVFEPGSVNKVITASAALEEGLVGPEEMFVVPDTYRYGGTEFHDSDRHRTKRMSFAEIIGQSSNIGTIKVAERVGEERLNDYLHRFGYGQTSGLGYPGESAGLLPPVEAWSATSLPTIAIGQGVAATLLQVADVFEVVASGGEWVEPRLIRGSVADDGRLRPASLAERRRVVSAGTAAALAEMLTGVVEHGTGGEAAVDGYRVAGKTGTAQKASERGGYEDGAYVASFAGFAPAEDPALVVAVMLDEPRPVYYGGLTAAPTFAQIMEFALGHRRVPPSDPSARRATPPTAG